MIRRDSTWTAPRDGHQEIATQAASGSWKLSEARHSVLCCNAAEGKPALDQKLNSTLKNGFPPFQNEQALTLAVESVCAKFGKVKALQIFPASRDPRGGGLQCLCLLHLDPPAAQAVFRRELKASTYAGGLAFLADVDEKWIGLSM